MAPIQLAERAVVSTPGLVDKTHFALAYSRPSLPIATLSQFKATRIAMLFLRRYGHTYDRRLITAQRVVDTHMYTG
jgi:hypothetical protein